VRNAENEAVVLGMWADYDRHGLPGILRWATDDAQWRPHSADGRLFRSTSEYREQVEESVREGVRIDSVRLGIWSHDDVVVVRGRLRVRRGSVIDDSRMYWVHRVREGKVCWTASSPDLVGLLGESGVGREQAQAAFAAMHGARG
jgi:hypothetical protein